MRHESRSNPLHQYANICRLLLCTNGICAFENPDLRFDIDIDSCVNPTHVSPVKAGTRTTSTKGLGPVSLAPERTPAANAVRYPERYQQEYLEWGAEYSKIGKVC